MSGTTHSTTTLHPTRTEHSNPPVDNILLSSGNYLIDTLYLYSRDTSFIIGYNPKNNTSDNLCINALQFIINEAKTEKILSDVADTDHIDATNLHIQTFFNNGVNKTTDTSAILNTFFSAFARLQTNLFDLKTDTTNKFTIESINNLNLFGGQFEDYTKLNKYTPINIFNLKLDNNTGYTLDNHIQTTFDYVLFLFSISMATNWNGNWIDIDKKEKANLKRRNGMIVSFLSIFTAYFKPILDANIHINGAPQSAEYTQIIRFINKIIYLHNSILDEHNQINNGIYGRELTGTTYDYNKSAAAVESESKNFQNVKGLNADKSYDILDEYNKDLIDNKQEFNPDKAIPEYAEPGLVTVNLKSSNADKKTEILLPQLPSAAAWEPILSKRGGLAGVEINKVLDEINLGMCKSTIGLTSSETQFKVTGIPFSNISFIRSNLFFCDGDHEKNESHHKNKNIDITKYFEAILLTHYDQIQKFRILTAIDNHYDKVYFTKVGSFDLHITADTYKKVITNCKTESRFKFITGIHAYDKNPGFLKLVENVAKLQAAHRVMLIFDIPTDGTHPKIYYYEPFGQFFPVYDMYGRLIPDMQERVIKSKLAEMYNTIAEMPNPVPQIVIPYIGDTIAAKNYCNSGIFNLSRAAYFGYGDIHNSIINSVINSTDLHNDKTLDWVSGYCGLIIIFMMVMVKINCDMQTGNPRVKTIDDIFIWFNEFNTDPFNTYDNLMSRFILRGFGRVVENILEGKQQYIQPVVYNLEDNNISSKFKVDSHGKLISKLDKDLKNLTQQDLTSTLFNLIGIKNPLALQNDTLRKKLNSVIQFMYQRINYSDSAQIKLDGDNIFETDNDLYDKLFNLNNRMAEYKQDNPDKTLDVVPIRLGSIFGSWISKYNIFRKKGKVGILPLAANNAMTATATGDIINTNPTIHRVLFIDTKPPPATTP